MIPRLPFDGGGRVLSCRILALLFALFCTVESDNSAAQDQSAEAVLANELIVKFQRGVGRQNRQAALAHLAAKAHHFEENNNGPGGRRGPSVFDQLVHVELEPGVDPQAAIRDLRQDPRVEYAEPNFVVEALESFPNDADFNLLWGLDNTGQSGGAAGADIAASGAWDTSVGSAGVVVAVIDTGVEYSHPDLAANMWANPGETPANGLDDDGNGFVDDVYGYDFYNDDSNPMDDHFHGTHCAGTIGAVGNNGAGIAGVNWDVSLMALKFLSASGSGNTADAVSAIQYAINNGAQVMSNSWGGSGYSQALQDVILAAHNAGIVFVAAAGNNGNDNLVYPAAYDKVIAISATDHNDLKASFSSYGAFVDVAAPGVNIYSTKLNGSYGYASGTSMATPHVAGLAALTLAVDGALSPAQVEYLLETSADDLGNPGWDAFYGAGRINASNAVQTVFQQNVNFPTIAITAPSHGEVVSGQTVNIVGTAAGSGFMDYTLEYAEKGSGAWQVFASAASPVQDGLLGAWDTGQLMDGEYLIRLTVTDALGRRIQEAVHVSLDNYEAAITTPNQLVSLGNVEVLGSAETKNGMPFDSYTLEWGLGPAPSSFSTAGITLVNGGLSAVIDGSLATWDTSGLSNGQTYTLRLTVHSAAGGYAEAAVWVKADQDLVMGWPISLSADSTAFIVPTVADLDGDGMKEVITAGPDERIRVYRKDGSDFPGFPVVLSEGDYFRWGVNVDDLDGNGTNEIIAVVSNPSFSPRSNILVLNYDGTPFAGWSDPGLDKAQSSSDITPTVADLNGDGAKDLVLVELFTWVFGTEVKLHAFDLSGNELAGFPRLLTLPPVEAPPGPDEMYPSKYGVVSIADLDRDGYPEIAWSYSNRIYLFDHQGNVLPGWPFIAPLYNGNIMLFENAAASGDIDGDGQLELFSVGRNTGCASGCTTQLYGWRKDGSVLPGWPKTDQSDGIKLGNSANNQNTPVLADLDGDGKDEVIVGLGNLAVFDEAGRTPFAGDSIASQTQPSVSDVDGDGRFEFSSNWYNSIGIVDDDGSYYWRQSMPASGLRNTLGILADLDADGGMELVVSYADNDQNITLLLWEMPGAGLASGEWGMFNHDAARSGAQNWTEPAPPEDGVPPETFIDSPADGSTVSSTVSVAVSAVDNVGVTLVEVYLDGALIGVDDTEPYAVAWDTTTVANGDHTLAAVAYDAAGNGGSSPPVAVTVANDTPPPSAPAAPDNLTADLTNDTVALNWRDNSNNEEGFSIERGTKVKGSVEYVAIGQVSANVTTYTETISSGFYYYRLRAFNQTTGLVSGYSSEVLVKNKGN